MVYDVQAVILKSAVLAYSDWWTPLKASVWFMF